MDPFLIYPVGVSDSCHYASKYLKTSGFSITDHPAPEVTHLLLDVPSFDESGYLRNGSDLKELLRMLPKNLTVIGGNLSQNYLAEYRAIDLLENPYYLAKNAAITAECALQVASPYLLTIWKESPALILGWGRIGKCLAGLLTALGCPVTVAARKSEDRAMLETLGFEAVDFPLPAQLLQHYKIVFNTVPDLPLHKDFLSHWKDGIAIDLASYPGMQCNAAISARGLPGKHAPASSGKLIAESIIRLMKEE